MEDREVDSEIGIALSFSIPVFPGASAQLLLIVLAPDFTIVKITEQRLLEREQILLNQETRGDSGRAGVEAPFAEY